ncbi:hypothetical protein VDGL01_02707 [Verticillium dahliae]
MPPSRTTTTHPRGKDARQSNQVSEKHQNWTSWSQQTGAPARLAEESRDSRSITAPALQRGGHAPAHLSIHPVHPPSPLSEKATQEPKREKNQHGGRQNTHTPGAMEASRPPRVDSVESNSPLENHSVPASWAPPHAAAPTPDRHLTARLQVHVAKLAGWLVHSTVYVREGGARDMGWAMCDPRPCIAALPLPAMDMHHALQTIKHTSSR